MLGELDVHLGLSFPTGKIRTPGVPVQCSVVQLGEGNEFTVKGKALLTPFLKNIYF